MESQKSSMSDTSKPELHQALTLDSHIPESHAATSSDAIIPELYQASRSDASIPELYQSSRSDASIPELYQASRSDARIPESLEVSMSDTSIPELYQASRLDASIPESHHVSWSDASIPRIHPASKSVEKQQILITQIESKPASTVIFSTNETCVSEPQTSNPDVSATFKPEYDNVIDNGDAGGNKLQTVEQDVILEQPVDDSATSNTHETPLHEINKETQDADIAVRNVSKGKTKLEDSLIKGSLTNRTDELQGDVAFAIPSTESNDETLRNFELDNSTEMQLDTTDSNDEESDMDFDESDYDEMEEEEICSKLIHDFKDNENNKEKMETNNENFADAEFSKNNKNTSAESVIPKSSNALEKKRISQKPNAEKLVTKTVKSRMDISPLNEEDTNQIKVIVFGETQPKQMYQFRNKIFPLKETITPQDLLCNYCKKDVRTIKELKEHEGSHTKTYSCYKCDKVFNSQLKLRAHSATCFEIPQFVKNYFKTNPECSPKRRWTAPKSVVAVEEVDQPCDFGTSENNLSSSTFERSAVKGVFFYRNSLKQLFECEDCLKKFKFRISLKKHTCKAFLEDNRTGKLIATDKAEHLNGDKLAKEKLGEKKWSYKELLKWRIINKTCPFPNCGRKYRFIRQIKEHLVTHTTEKQNTGKLKTNIKTRCKTANKNNSV
ncbi:uncharacterized protein LOC123553850 [Mercenaria mercenaria]|uniref:uncharacterized protein LOC123553850 n=1 Tax=Mercenaria mercenaria TaxID=6596 RepID=UPI00234F29A1|nr:uncharacterized protein LOC123553850 [Mercenaria mercenaria]XP_053404743.1 uncharacterized protein LOC123553850 [Mercenaria mercenaria]